MVSAFRNRTCRFGCILCILVLGPFGRNLRILEPRHPETALFAVGRLVGRMVIVPKWPH